MSEIRSRAFCYTLNNYTPHDYALLSGYHPKTVSYHVVGKEVGESGTPHLQGYIHFTDAKRLTTLINELSVLLGHKRTHFEAARGTALQNMEYCTKQGQAVQLGTLPKQGKRNDILSIYDAVKKKTSLHQYVEHHPMNYQQIRTYEKLEHLYCLPRTQKPTVFWIYGPTGTGKSYLARTLSTPDVYHKSNTKWWNGYIQQSTVIVNDVRGDFMSLHDMLNFLDRDPYQVETKGGIIEFNSPVIIFTAPFPPEELYQSKKDTEDLRQLSRRITHKIDLTYRLKFLAELKLKITKDKKSLSLDKKKKSQKTVEISESESDEKFDELDGPLVDGKPSWTQRLTPRPPIVYFPPKHTGCVPLGTRKFPPNV